MCYEVEGYYRYKIGNSNNVSRRLRETRTYIPDIKLLAKFESHFCTYVERSVQKHFSEHLYDGEIFVFADGFMTEKLFLDTCMYYHKIAEVMNGNHHFKKLHGITKLEDDFL
jgi:hypothetical protein